MDEKNKKSITRELEIDARAINIPSGAAEIFIQNSLDAVEKKLKKKHTVTDNDLTRLISNELKKYNTDLAYVYKNHDKII